MVQIKLFVAFILATVAIVPIAALPTDSKASPPPHKIDHNHGHDPASSHGDHSHPNHASGGPDHPDHNGPNHPDHGGDVDPNHAGSQAEHHNSAAVPNSSWNRKLQLANVVTTSALGFSNAWSAVKHP